MSAANDKNKKLANPPRPRPQKDGIASVLDPEEMHKLDRLVLLSRYVVEGNLAGAHRSPLRGPSSEFADHKAYGQGDDPKHIDWRVLARTEKYYIKRYQDETNLRVYLAVDHSASMDYGSGTVTKYQYACHLATALGYVVVKSRDSVGLVLHSDKVEARRPARNSLQHLNNLVKILQEQNPASTTALADALHEIASSVRRRALIVVISDLLDDEESLSVALAHLRKQHHDVIILQVLDPVELDLSLKSPCEMIDLENDDRMAVDPRSLAADYKKVFGEFLEHHRKSCAGLNIDYRIARTDESPENFIRTYLRERRKLSK